MRRNFIVYDANCFFCVGLAKYFKNNWNIKIVPNNKTCKYISEKDIKRDVHFVSFCGKKVKIYHGAEASIRILGVKYPFFICIYKIPILKQLIKICYLIVKKSRKYLKKLF